METEDTGTGEPSSRLGAPASTNDRLFVVKGVVWWGAGVGVTSPGALACAGAGIPTHTPPRETFAWVS